MAYADSVFNNPAARGWWFYQKTTNPKKIIINHSEIIDKKPLQIDCHNPDRWIITCGFVETKNYSFEQVQYHQLLRNFAMNPEDLNAVQQFQRFNYWAVSHAMAASYSWQYNLVQNPELDGTVINPVSQFGNLMVMNIEKSSRKDFFKLLSNSSFLVYFSRTDCKYCLAESSIVQLIQKNTGITVWNASLDKGHLSGYELYLTEPITLMPAQILQVNRVPALFLYLAPNESRIGAKWIRLATGLTTEQVIEERLINFVEAYRHALIQGAAQGEKRSIPNFSILHDNILANEIQQ